MGRHYSFTPLAILITIVIISVLIQPTAAFGAGNVPSFSYLEDKAFRHGDIEDTLEKLAKVMGSGFLGIGGGKKFGGLDIKRVYFGNWLRDFSQAMDTAALSKVSKQAILNLVMVMGFMTHGYATGEFEVTEERLGVYLPVEHIDNPKGYYDGNDARKIHPLLRPPVQQVELEIDPRTGMKNYIANDNGFWDTSTKYIRRILEQCIKLGRQGRRSGRDEEIWEAYRLMGTALHTLEDLAAHSNFCELALLRMGNSQVFCHVGNNVVVQSPSGPCPPLVTGTFGGSDFMHSVLGEAGDHLSQASVTDLQMKVKEAKESNRSGSDAALRSLLFSVPGGGGDSMSRDVEQATRAAQEGNPDQMSPQEMYATLWKVLTVRDRICKTIENTIEKIPGLSALVEKITDAINKWVFTTLEPYLKPLMVTATQTLSQGSGAVISQEAQTQYEVFDNPNASDPTHSILAKDHFDSLLNEPAGNLAIIIVKHSVQHIVKAWDDESANVHRVIDTIVQAIHHPYFADTNSPVQSDMARYMKEWFQNCDQRYVLQHLTKEAVRKGDNKRKGTSAALSDQNQYHSMLPTPSELMNDMKQSFTQQNRNEGYQRGASSGGGHSASFYEAPEDQRAFGGGNSAGYSEYPGQSSYQQAPPVQQQYSQYNLPPPLPSMGTGYPDPGDYNSSFGGGFPEPQSGYEGNTQHHHQHHHQHQHHGQQGFSMPEPTNYGERPPQPPQGPPYGGGWNY